MNPSRHLFAAAVFALGLLRPAFAIPFTGTITQTITESNSSLYQVGQTYVGHYYYDAPSIDGDFMNYPADSAHPNAIQAHLNADLFLFDLGWGDLNTGGFVMNNEMIVENGHVTKFYKEGQKFFADFFFVDFGFGYGYGDYSNKHISGTLTFGDPQPVSDEASTGAVAAFSLATLCLLRRRFKN